MFEKSNSQKILLKISRLLGVKIYILITCFVSFTVISVNAQKVNTPFEIIEKMFEAIDNNNNLQGSLFSEERLDGFNQKNQIEFKLSNKPRTIYIKAIEPNNGVEILYNPSLYGADRVYVNPNKFFVPNIKLSIQNRLMLDKRHHTLVNLGFEFLKEVFIDAFNRAGEEVDTILDYKGIVQFDGRACYEIEIIDPTYATKNYTVQKGEDIFSISSKLLISEYSIIEMNEAVDSFWDLSEGDVITVPTSYAPKTTLYVDKENYLPIMQLMEDDKGLFEKYEFKNLKVIKSYATNEFDPSFNAYAF